MHIDIVIGNPPYQDGNQSIYPRFIDDAIALNPKIIVMITRSNWLKGNTLKSTRDNMIRFGIKKLILFNSLREVFKGVSVETTIFELVSNNHIIGYTEIENDAITRKGFIKAEVGKPIITELEYSSIIKKVIESYDFIPYDLAKNPRMFSIGSNGYFMYATYTEPIIKYTKEKIKPDDVEVLFMDSSHSPYSMYTSREDLPKGKEYIDKYKVLCGSKARSNSTVLTSLMIIKPGQIMTNSFNIVAVVDTEEEANNILKYAKTKFQRALIKSVVCGDRTAYGVGRTIYVPLQNFTSKSDINWNVSITDIDKQLYKKYNLSQEEISYIESTINSI